MRDGPLPHGELDEGRHCNYWEWNPVLRREVERLYPDDEFAWAEGFLSEFAEVVGHDIADNAEVIDREGHELRTYDSHGKVQNHVAYHPLQAENDRLVYDRGLTHDSFHAPPGREEPLGFQHALVAQSLLAHVDGGFVCPVSMTTGVAIILERFVTDDQPNADLLREYLDRLTSRNAADHIEGAMFLTEKQGGSDVGANETRAEPTDEAGVYRIYGEKWFCSNIDAEGTLVLARRPDAPEGIPGLSLFLVPNTRRDGAVNDQRYRRLKDKLGTISVPTGEVEFHGAEAFIVGEPENGFRYMAEMMNFERLTQATGSVGAMARLVLASVVHAANREAFGEPIDQFPLMRRDLVGMQVDFEAAAAFGFTATDWYARYMRQVGAETGWADGPSRTGLYTNRTGLTDDTTADGGDVAPPDANRTKTLMRLLVPIAKCELARMGVEMASAACEVKGGNGYVNGFETEQMLRDAQVGPIWEGTSNILALDVLRVLDELDAHEELFWLLRQHLESVDHPLLADARETVERERQGLQEALGTLASAEPEYAEYEATQLVGYIFDVVTGALLCSRAQKRLDAGDARKTLVARQFVRTRFGDRPARDIADGERPADEFFEEIVRFDPIAPADLDTAVSTGD